ncbi:MAG: helix-turn-helix domain-containing protein [Acidimicrobiia bacterium]|nr:helix-turn-helix domain-containing protein [Acidimicrobiia bacterium]
MTVDRATAKHLSDLAWLRRARDRIDRDYDQPLDVEALARGVHMSAGHFSRQFKAAYGESSYSYLMTRRVERAMALLRRGGVTVTEVCFASSYSRPRWQVRAVGTSMDRSPTRNLATSDTSRICAW